MGKVRRSRADKERLRKEAKERDEANAKLSILDKIAKLDARLGKNIGAKKERTRLKKLLEEQMYKEEQKEKTKKLEKEKEKKKIKSKKSKQRKNSK